MDKETLSNYGWIVICVLVLAVMIALATPFGKFIKDAVWSTTNGLFDVNQNALDAAGIVVTDQDLTDEYVYTNNKFNPNAVTDEIFDNTNKVFLSSTDGNYMSDIISCDLGDTVWVRYLQDDGTLTQIGASLYLIAENGNVVFHSAYTGYNTALPTEHAKVDKLVGVRIHIKPATAAGLGITSETLDRIMVTINGTEPHEFEPYVKKNQ